MEPSIGRIVHYQSHGSPNGQHKSEPRAAIVTAVQDGVTVSLAILNPTGMFFAQGVLFDTDAAPGTWRWPPRV